MQSSERKKQKKTVIFTTLMVEKSPQALPLGAACVASAVKNNSVTKGKFNVELIDFTLEDKEILDTANQTKFPDEKIARFIAEKLLQKQPEFIAFSVYVWNREILGKTALIIKEKSPETICIAGGPEPTANPWSFCNFDFAVAGQGENSVPELLAELAECGEVADGTEATDGEGSTHGAGPTHGARHLSSIKLPQGVYRRQNSRYTDTEKNPSMSAPFARPELTFGSEKNSARPELTSCTEKNSARLESAFSTEKNPARTQLTSDTEKNPAPIVRSVPVLPAELSSPYLDGTLDVSKYGGALWELARGCPFKCSYCYESKGEKKVSFFPEERLRAELDLFAEKKIPQIFVLDPTYNADKARAAKILSLIREKTPDTFYYFEARAEFIDRPLARKFASIMCSLQIGLQSIHQNVLKNVNRTFDKKLFAKNIGILNEEGVVFGFDLIYGLPGDTFDGFKESVDFALKLYPNNLELFRLAVLPGTDLYERKSEFQIHAMETPPYSVIKTPEFPESDILRAEKFSAAATLFYTKGRAVTWFNSVIFALKERPSYFIEEFEKFLAQKKLDAQKITGMTKIRRLQKEFVHNRFQKKHLEKYIPLADDIINFFGALSDADGEGKTTELTLNHHPEDLESPYALDFRTFTANVRPFKTRIRIFPTADGADWTVL